MVFPANFAHPSRTASREIGADSSPALVRAAGLAGWTLVIGCLVWRGPFRFVLATVGTSLLLHGAARRDPTAPSGARGTVH